VGFLFNFLSLKPFSLPDHRKLLLICVLVLTAFLFINFCIIREYLPEYFPNAQVIIPGILWGGFIWALFHVVFKRILKGNDSVSLAYLTIFGALIVLFSELIFQTCRIATDMASDEILSDNEAVRMFLLSVLGLPIVSVFFSFPTALDLKYKNRALTTIVNIAMGLLFYFSAPYVASFIKGE
jgi:hypothetical protein